MKKLLILLAFITSMSCNAQSTHPDANSSKDPRFVIVQSPIAMKLTFKLDTYNGDVYQLVIDPNGKYLWQRVNRLMTVLPDTRYPETRNYSLFLSTLAIRYTYLINTNTGATWLLTEDTGTKAFFFDPLIDQ